MPGLGFGGLAEHIVEPVGDVGIETSKEGVAVADWQGTPGSASAISPVSTAEAYDCRDAAATDFWFIPIMESDVVPRSRPDTGTRFRGNVSHRNRE